MHAFTSASCLRASTCCDTVTKPRRNVLTSVACSWCSFNCRSSTCAGQRKWQWRQRQQQQQHARILQIQCQYKDSTAAKMMPVPVYFDWSLQVAYLCSAPTVCCMHGTAVALSCCTQLLRSAVALSCRTQLSHSAVRANSRMLPAAQSVQAVARSVPIHTRQTGQTSQGDPHSPETSPTAARAHDKEIHV